MKFRDTFNRIVVVIACLVLIAAVVALVAFPTIFITAGEWLAGLGQIFENGQTPEVVIGAVVAFLVVLLLAFVIYWQLRSMRGGFVRVQRVTGGTAKVSTKSAKDMLEHQLALVPGVLEIDSQVRARGNRVSVQVEADVRGGTNVPEAANRMIKETQRVFTDELGLQIEGPPEVSVTIVRDEAEVERREEAARSAQPSSYTAVEADRREDVRERRRKPVMAEEEMAPVVPEPSEEELRELEEPEVEERRRYEVEEREQERERLESDRGPFDTEPDYEEIEAYETEDMEAEGDDDEYRPEGGKPTNRYDDGEEIHTH